jgi:hypothetical protein
VWGFSSTVAFIYGALMYNWYPSNIKDDNIRFPDAVGTAVSQEWALGTREISAWDSASKQMMYLNGFGCVAWAANLALGQEGNQAHRVFYTAVSALRFAPLLSVYHALYIQRQYLPNGAVYDQEVLYAGSVPNKVLYLYDPDQTDDSSFSYLDYDSFYNRLFGLYLIAFLSLVGQNVTVSGIKDDWLVQNAAWKLANPAEEEAADEPVADDSAAEAAPEEEQFF